MTSILKRRAFSTAALAMLAAPSAFAQAPSDKVMRVIAAGPAGGSLDVVSRLLAEGLHKELNRTVIVEAKPGAGGALAVNDLMQAAHDGDTMVVALDAMVSEIPHIMKLRIDMTKEVRPIAELLWESAGRPDGTADRDWRRAEEIVREAEFALHG